MRVASIRSNPGGGATHTVHANFRECSFIASFTVYFCIVNCNIALIVYTVYDLLVISCIYIAYVETESRHVKLLR